MKPGRRLQLLGGASLAALLALAGRLYAVSIARHEELREKAIRRSRRADVLPARRGQVLDRLGRPLALDLPVDDVALDLLELDPALELIAPVGSALGLPRADAWARLLDARALAREQAAGLDDDDPAPVPLGSAPLAAAERVRKALKGEKGLSLSYEPGGVAVLAAPEALLAAERTLARLAALLDEDAQALQAAFLAEVAAILAEPDRERRLHRWRRPLVVRPEAPFDVVAGVAERQGDLPGVRVLRRYRRLYPRGELAAHLVGTLSAPTPEEQARDRAAGLLVDEGADALGLLMGRRQELPGAARLRDQPRGRTGVERAFDEALAGRPGVRVVVRDAKGRTRATLTDLPPRDGRDLTLTLDADLQAVVEAALDQAVAAHGEHDAGGAAVVLDLRQGDVLALASSPRYDPNAMGQRFPEWSADPRLPLFDRSISAFPPASTWKVLTSFAAMDPRGERAAPLGWTTDCQGKLFPGRKGPFKCDGHHGTTDLGRALERSCNVFFFRLADRAGVDPLASWAERFGLRRRLLGLPGERAGFVPSSGFKARRVDDSVEALHARWSRTLEAFAAQGADPAALSRALRRLERSVWWVGCCLADRAPLPADARNAFIGQGVVLATPAQVAWLAAVVATGGRTPRPRLLRDAPVEWQDAALPAALLARVRDGMRRVVTSGTASGPRLGLRDLDVAGKTGTAERLKDQPKLAWFMGYYPASHPQVAFAVLVDRTQGHGGEVCAPVAKAIVEQLRGKR